MPPTIPFFFSIFLGSAGLFAGLHYLVRVEAAWSKLTIFSLACQYILVFPLFVANLMADKLGEVTQSSPDALRILIAILITAAFLGIVVSWL